MEFYEKLRSLFKDIIEKEDLQGEDVHVHIGQLSPKESIGITERKDFPLLNGKEQMVQAEFKGAKGQAFTSSRAVYNGSLEEVAGLDLEDDFNKAVFISTLNAVLKYLGKIDRTVHCKYEEPERCGKKAADFIAENYAGKNIGFVGYQPAMIDHLSKKDLPLRVLDLNPDHVGRMRYGVLIEDGVKDFESVVSWADVLFVTGSTICNGTITDFLALDIPVVFYGNTIAGTAYLLGLDRICFEAS